MTLLRPRSARPAGAVPLARRMLASDRRRAGLTVLGVASSLLLVLLLDGILAGAIERVTAYINASPATLFVSQSGVRTMHMSASALPPDAAADARSVPGVDWAAAIGFGTGSLAGPGGRMLTYLIGYDTEAGYGGPGWLVAGRPPRAGEAVLDQQAADRLGLSVGDSAVVLGERVRVSGLSTGGTSITNTTVFVGQAQYARMRGPRLSYLLVGTDPGVGPEAVADRLRSSLRGVTVQTREEFASSEARIVSDMSADLLRLMSAIGLLVALAVVAVGQMAATLARVRDFAVLKALGATGARLVVTATAQAFWTVVLGALLAAVAALAIGWLLPLAVPAIQVSVTPAAVARTTGGALLVGLLAAVWPVRRVATVDAATAFRESR